MRPKRIKLLRPYADLRNTYRADTSGGVYGIFHIWGDWIVIFKPREKPKTRHALREWAIKDSPFKSLSAARRAVDEHAAFYAANV